MDCFYYYYYQYNHLNDNYEKTLYRDRTLISKLKKLSILNLNSFIMLMFSALNMLEYHRKIKEKNLYKLLKTCSLISLLAFYFNFIFFFARNNFFIFLLKERS